MQSWPRGTQTELLRFYGTPGPEVERQLVKVVPPFAMYYRTDKGNKRISSLVFHKKAADALLAALNDIWDACGRDQAKLDALGVSQTGGTYNPRKIAGSDDWSNHAFGAAIDFDPARNGFGKGKGTIPAFVIAAFDKVGFRWGGRYKGRTDPMHFEACDSGLARPAGAFEIPFATGNEFEAYDGEAHSKGCCLLDDAAPLVDDHGDNEAPQTQGGVMGHLRRRWKEWTTSGALSGLTAWLTDPNTWLYILGFVLVLILLSFGAALWLFGKARVAAWVARRLGK